MKVFLRNFFFALPVDALCFTLYGWVFAVGWNKLVAPVFHLTTLTLIQAIGLVIFWSYINTRANPKAEAQAVEDFWGFCGEKIFRAVVTTSINWIIIKLFVGIFL